MSPEPQPDAQSDSKDAANAVSRDRLPFEPTKSRKKPEKKTPTAPVKPEKKSDSKKSGSKSGSKKETTTVKGDRSGQTTATSMAIPDAVSRRMVRRMALFCGIPSALGISTFFVSYFVTTHNLVALPNVAVVLVSMGFFGLGVVGLSYGVLSASWDEEAVGSALGWSEFTTNLGRMTEAWRSSGKKT